MDYKWISYEIDGQVALITINRPEVLNALHAAANEELRDAFVRFRDEHGVGVAIITGAGDRAFSAGNDLKVSAERSRDGQSVTVGGAPFGGITRDFWCAKPIIAAVNGFALGGGFELALACDIIVASTRARFGLPEPRVGLYAAAGGVHRLPRQVPLKIAMGMMLTGRQISADEAWRLGLVNEVVSTEELPSAARRWAAEILACSPASIRTTKEAALTGLGMSVEEAMHADTTSGRTARLFDSPDAREGPTAFSEKRPPAWQPW